MPEETLETLRHDLRLLAQAGVEAGKGGLATCNAIVKLASAVEALCEGRTDDAMALASAARLMIRSE